MNELYFHIVAGAIFSLVLILHVLRIAFGWQVAVGDWSAPMWVSWLAIIIAALLAVESFRLGMRKG